MAGLGTVAAVGGLGGDAVVAAANSRERRRSSAWNMSERGLGLMGASIDSDEEEEESDDEEDTEAEMTTKLIAKMASMETLEEENEDGEEDCLKEEKGERKRKKCTTAHAIDCNSLEAAIQRRSNWKFRRVRMRLFKKDYDLGDDDDHSNDASFENFYDAPTEAASTGMPEVRINMDPSDRLVEALETLKDVIVENTNCHTKQRRRGRSSTGNAPQFKADGTPMPKDGEKLKIRKEKVIVELRVVFLKIGEIDTLKEQYSADTFIQAKWREPALDGRTMEELKRVDLDRYWNPLLYIDNILSETKEATWQTATSNSRGEAYILERRRVRGVFMENLELNDFPLDVQDLTVTITSERPDTEIDIIPDENEMSGINVQTFVDQQEWRLHEHIEVSKKVMTQEYSSSNRCHPALSVTCRAARRPGYFYWNVFLVMFFISALSFATFAVSPELPQNRLQLSFTLLLTSVAFKFVINQSLPKISYLTYMDKYVLLSLVILCVVCIWHAVVTVFTQHGASFLAELERDVFIAFAVIYIVCHLVFIFWLYFDACKRRRLMKNKDREYLKLLKSSKAKPSAPGAPPTF